MIRFAPFTLALSLAATPLAAQSLPQLSLEHRMLVRCSAAFALAANRQAAHDPEALAWPALKERGSEFFVRASARVMDEAGLDRAGIAEVLAGEARALAAEGELARTMPACLAALEAAQL